MVSFLLSNGDRMLDMGRLLEQYGDTLLRVCFLYLKDPHLAEDAVHDTLIKAYKSYAKFKGDCSEKTWLTRIAVNVCKNYMRSSWWRRTYPVNDLDCIPRDEGADGHPQDETLLLEVMKLSQKYKLVILMYYYQEMLIKEISQVLKIPEGTVSVRLKRARETLKSKLKGWYYDE
jgi:RNA polymerase sigma-70 factor (ECF subfamily)